MALQTFVFLGQRDRFSVLFWWDREAWPVILALWLKDLALAGGAAALSVLLLRVTARADAATEALPVGRAAMPLALGMLVLGTLSRVAAPESIPPGLFSDTVWSALPAVRGAAWLRGAPFGEGATQIVVSPLPLAFAKLTFIVWGAGEDAVHALCAGSGLLAAAAIALLAGVAYGARRALLAGALATFGRWPLVLSRWAWGEELTVATACLAVGCALVAVRRRRALPGLFAGLAAGAAVHGHPSGLAFAGTFVTAATLVAWRRRDLRRAAGAAIAGTALLVAAWLALYVARGAKGRYGAVALGTAVRRVDFAGVPARWRFPAALAFNARVYTGLLLWTGDPNPRMGNPGAPLVSPVLGVAALLGLALTLRDARRGDPAAIGLASLAAAALASGVLANPDGAPNSLRACLLAPPLFVAAARSLEAWGDLLVKRGIRLAVTLAALAAVLIAFEVVPALAVWPQRPEVARGFFSEETEAARRIRALAPLPTILDPGAVRQPAVDELLAAGGAPLARRRPAELAAREAPPRFWYLTARSGVDSLRAAGFRVARPTGRDGATSVVLVVRPRA